MLLGSILIGNCFDLAFFLAWFKCPFTVATYLGKYFLAIFDLNPGHDWKNNYLLPISMYMEKSWNIQHVGNVSVLVVMKFDVHYWFSLCVYVLVIPLVFQWVGFSIIHCFCILVPVWLSFRCVWLSLIVLWTHMCIQHHIVFQLIQVIHVWY